MSIFPKWWRRRPLRKSQSQGRRYRAELETLEDRVTPSLSSLTADVIGPNPITEDGTDVVTIRYTRTGDVSAPVTVPFDINYRYGLVSVMSRFTVTGADSPLNPNGSSDRGYFTFAAGELVHDLVFHPTNDGVAEGVETIDVGIRPLALDSRFQIADTRITSSTPTNFSLEVIGTNIVNECDTQGKVVRFTRHDGSTAAASDSVSVSGFAKLGVDFTLTGADSFDGSTLTFSFTAGETTHDVVFMPIQNTIMQDGRALFFGTTFSNQITTLGFLDDDHVPLTADLIGSNPLDETSGDVLTIRYTRTGDTSAPLTVPFSLSGDVHDSLGFTFSGMDSYSNLDGFFTFAAGESVHDLVVHPTGAVGFRAFSVLVRPIDLMASFEMTGTASPSNPTDPLPDAGKISWSLSPGSVVEDSGQPIVVTLRRTSSSVAVRVRFQLQGSAKEDVDYTVTGATFYTVPAFTPAIVGVGITPSDPFFHYGEVDFPAGVDVITFVIHPTADQLAELDESIVIEFIGGADMIDQPSLSATIVNDDSGVVIDPLPPIQNPPYDIGTTSPLTLSLPNPGQSIESLYLNLLGRSSDSDGKQKWLTQFSAGTPMKNIVLGFEQSPEFAQKFVREKYQQVLSRAPEADGLAYWSAKITAGESTDTVVRALLLSPEATRLVSSNADFVSKTYVTILGRATDPTAATWIQGLDNGGARVAFVQNVIDSGESRDSRISSAYQTYLHRSATDAEKSAALKLLSGSDATPSKFLASLLSDDEFLVHA